MGATEFDYIWRREDNVVVIEPHKGQPVRLTLQDLYYMRKRLIRWTPERAAPSKSSGSLAGQDVLSGAQKNLLAELYAGGVLREGPEGGYELVRPGHYRRNAHTGTVRAMLRKGILVFVDPDAVDRVLMPAPDGLDGCSDSAPPDRGSPDRDESIRRSLT